MRRSAASAELTRQVAKSTPAACERASEDDAQLGFFLSSLSLAALFTSAYLGRVFTWTPLAHFVFGYASTAGTSTMARCVDARRRWRCPLVRLCVLFHFPCSCRYSARLTCVAHVSEETGVSCEGQLSVPVLRVWSLLVSHPQVETRVRQRCEEQGPLSCSLFPDLGMSGDTEAETLFSGKAEMCEVHTVVRCWSTHNKCDTALGTCGDAEGDLGRLRLR